MLTVVECVVYQHDLAIVALAAGIIIAGMLAFYQLLVRAEESTVQRRNQWIAIAALASGLSIWATHFVAMLAYDGSMPIGFDIPFTVISAVTAVAGMWWSLNLPGNNRLDILVKALCMTGTVAAMHFLGMTGMQVAAEINYQILPVAAGSVLSFILFTASLSLFRHLNARGRIVCPAIAAIAGVCVLHFTTVSSTVIIPDPMLAGPDPTSFGRMWLIGAISSVTVMVLLVTAAAAWIDRYLVDLKGFANASLDGLAVIREGRIIEVNARFAALAGRLEHGLIGQDPNDYLIAADGIAVDVSRDGVIEAAPRVSERPRVYELAVHTIEYRGRPSQVVAVRDLTEKLAAQKEIEYLARHDMLTGLANRALLHQRLADQVESGDAPFAVIALDLDRFKAVNDLFGHAEGDRVLRDVAGIFKANARSVDMVARLGGDEFMIVMASPAAAEDAHDLARNILSSFHEKMNLTADPTAVGVSIGIALFPRDGLEAKALMHAADLALYRAKEGGRGMLAFYDLAMDQEIKQRRELEGDLRQAIGRGELYLLYQPVQSVVEGTVVGYEALLRWNHPVHGDIPRDVFIPIAEETGAIFKLGEWVLREACAAACAWPQHLKVAVNVSAVQFRVASLAFLICRILQETGLSPSRLELEITETALLKDREATLATLRQLKAIGISIVMDDFGTGYSSLSNLQSFPFDKIKIDRSFIASMKADDHAHAIVKAVVGLGRSLDLPVTAEGIETADQYAMVVSEGCAQAQGYLFGKPGAGPGQVVDLHFRMPSRR